MWVAWKEIAQVQEWGGMNNVNNRTHKLTFWKITDVKISKLTLDAISGVMLGTCIENVVSLNRDQHWEAWF
jgi:hypothetical protein